MNLSECWTELESVRVDAEVQTVFEVFAHNRIAPFLPIVDAQGVPVGVIREQDIKEFAYSRFGRELVKREPLQRFIRPSLILPHTVNRDDLLGAAASNQNPDGLILTQDGVYRAVMFNSVILRLFEANRVETQIRLVQAQKMEAIGTLAGGIAHDLNNILMPIIGYAQLLREMMDAHEPLDAEMLDQILVSGKRAKETVGRILAFSPTFSTGGEFRLLSGCRRAERPMISG